MSGYFTTLEMRWWEIRKGSSSPKDNRRIVGGWGRRMGSSPKMGRRIFLPLEIRVERDASFWAVCPASFGMVVADSLAIRAAALLMGQ